ncbi:MULTISPECIES: ABC transporter ATP-binding protein [Solibacillus]|uniref:ABC transporter ATP-binding protein n=1 Tax=Solibacillus faecavium TaxID=2762221 RepID=A0ABR8Y2F5_9BACL|nr:ABC transporter ATP-binding protein [Solibacillus faecavium]MBD8038399.1 ABC transporter ATP-binding protein [Solibacillus faecavium]
MLKINNMEAGYGKIMIVRDLDLVIESKEIVSIIGRNGIGKSTLVKSIIGLVPINKGELIYNSKAVTNKKAHERAWEGMGYVPQGHQVFPMLTVEENLRMGKLINKKSGNLDFEIIYNYFPKLFERRKQKAGTLSGGEQAALSLGRALVGNPELLILDEPTEGIQPNLVQEIGEIIKQINKDLGITVLLVEQHIGLIQAISQRCYAMDKGKIAQEIQGDDIKNYDLLKEYLAV